MSDLRDDNDLAWRQVDPGVRKVASPGFSVDRRRCLNPEPRAKEPEQRHPQSQANTLEW